MIYHHELLHDLPRTHVGWTVSRAGIVGSIGSMSYAIDDDDDDACNYCEPPKVRSQTMQRFDEGIRMCRMPF